MAVTKTIEDQQNAEQPVKAEETTTAAKKTDENGEELFTRSEVMALIDERMAQNQAPGGINAELASALKELAAATKATAANNAEEKHDPFKYLSPAVIEEDDMLEDPITFWACRFMYVIGDDKRNGVAIRAPYGRILFSSDGYSKNQTGKDINIIHWCKYTCFSRKEAEFLRSHSAYSIGFFEAKTDKIQIDAQAAMLMAQYYNSLKNTSAYQVMKQLKDSGLGHTTDVGEARMILAKLYADRELKAIKEAELVKIKDDAKRNMMVNQSIARG